MTQNQKLILLGLLLLWYLGRRKPKEVVTTRIEYTGTPEGEPIDQNLDFLMGDFF